jgi:hypothetical protein
MKELDSLYVHLSREIELVHLQLAVQFMEPLDLLSHARWELSFGSQTLLQSFTDFSTDCLDVDVVNVDGVAHDGTSLSR